MEPAPKGEGDAAAPEAKAPAPGGEEDLSKLSEQEIAARLDLLRPPGGGPFLLQVHKALGGREGALAAFLRGRALFMLEQDAPALDEFKSALSQNAGLHQASYYAGLVSGYMNEPAQCITMLEQAVATSGDAEVATQVKYRVELARAYMRQNDDEKGEQQYHGAIAVDPASFEARSGLGTCLLGRPGKEAEGEDQLRTAVQSLNGRAGPQHATTLYNLGTRDLKKGNWNEALRCFSLGESAVPEDWQLVSKVIQCHSALKQPAERDQAIARIKALRAAGKVNSPKFCIEQIKTDIGNVLVYDWFDFSGEFMRPSLSMHWESAPGVAAPGPWYVSLGSYDATAEMAWETGTPRDQRMWHLDLYDRGLHATLGMMPSTGRPAYEDVRDRMLNAMVRHANREANAN